MWELVHKEDWESKNCYFWIVVLEKTLESPLDCKKFKSVNVKRNQPWILIGRTDAEAEVLILFTSDANSQLIAKDTDAGNYWRQKKKGVAEKLDSIIRENSGGTGRQKGLACYNSWGPMSGTWLTVYTTTILYTFKNDIRNTMLAYLWHFFRIKTFKSSCNIYLSNFKEFYN